MDERASSQKSLYCSTGLRPLWGSCPASIQNHPSKYIDQFMNEQGKGISDHILHMSDQCLNVCRSFKYASEANINLFFMRPFGFS